MTFGYKIAISHPRLPTKLHNHFASASDTHCISAVVSGVDRAGKKAWEFHPLRKRFHVVGSWLDASVRRHTDGGGGGGDRRGGWNLEGGLPDWMAGWLKVNFTSPPQSFHSLSLLETAPSHARFIKS